MNPAESMVPPRPTALVQEILRPLIRVADLVIDATAGNGHDTLFLAECVGETGRVLVEFFLESHAAIATRAAPASVAVVMFNLGYLPGEDHDLTTEATETVAALNAAAAVLKGGGVLSIICYPGHPAGALEAAAVEAWVAMRTAEGWRAARYGGIGTRRPAPFLLLLVKAATA
jgi:predicted methyltransferase